MRLLILQKGLPVYGKEVTIYRNAWNARKVASTLAHG